jgi:hypothetical protein
MMISNFGDRLTKQCHEKMAVSLMKIRNQGVITVIKKKAEIKSDSLPPFSVRIQTGHSVWDMRKHH